MCTTDLTITASVCLVGDDFGKVTWRLLRLNQSDSVRIGSCRSSSGWSWGWGSCSSWLNCSRITKVCWLARVWLSWCHQSILSQWFEMVPYTNKAVKFWDSLMSINWWWKKCVIRPTTELHRLLHVSSLYSVSYTKGTALWALLDSNVAFNAVKYSLQQVSSNYPTWIFIHWSFYIY